MYIPPHFVEKNLSVLHAAIRNAGLATLVTMGPEGLIGSPLPLMLDGEDGEFGTLYGHLARANPQWRAHDPAVEALAMFMGADAYISPAWYETKRETGKVVPTWNYITIHAYGPVTFFEDATELLDVVTRLTGRHEGERAEPWAVSDAPAPFVQSQLKGIVGFRMPLTRLQGKWKMSQNRNLADRSGVVAGLEADGWAVSDAPAPFVQSQLKGIVGFRMPLTRLQGKWKMSQNRNLADRSGVVAGLEADGKAEVAAIIGAGVEA